FRSDTKASRSNGKTASSWWCGPRTWPRAGHASRLPRGTDARESRMGLTRQDLRSFVSAYADARPGEVVRITDTVSIEHDVMALVLEYERRRRYPILIFERVAGYGIPIVANVVASRRALAFALGVPEGQVAEEYGRRIKEHIKPVVVTDP